VSDKGRARVKAALTQMEKLLTDREKTDILQAIGVLEELQAVVGRARQAVEAGDWSTAYDLLTASSPVVNLQKFIKNISYSPRKVTAPKATAPITIDGDLKEWPQKPAGALNQQSQVRTGTWKGEADASGQFQVRWDTNNLYLAIRVQDNVLWPDPSANLHQGDCVEIFIDADLLGDLGNERCNEDDTHLKLALPVKLQGPVRMFRRQARRANQSITEIQAAWKKTTDGY